MSLSPYLSGRLPGTLVAAQLQRSIGRAQADLNRIGQQAATGQRIFRPGEDPAAATRAVVLQREVERDAQYVANTRTDAAFLSASDNALAGVSDLLNQAKAAALAGVGTTTTPAEKQGLAVEAASILSQLVRTANATYQGRSLFGGSRTAGEPFVFQGDGTVLYRGDAAAIDSHLDPGALLANNVDGQTAFNALAPPAGGDLNPALTLGTRLSDLRGGVGVPLGPVRVTVDDGVNPAVAATVDFTGAETVADLKTRLEAAFPAGGPTLTLGIDAAGHGLSLTPSAGTVAVAEVNGGLTATRLGLTSAPAATIDGGDLNPAISLTTRLDDLNGGAAAFPAGSFQILGGGKTATIDLSAATTVEDALNAIQSQAAAQGVQVAVGLSDDRRGIAVAGRVGGADFSIAEAGGTTAAALGLRTFKATTRLSELGGGVGLPTGDGQTLDVTRRDGSVVQIDLAGAATVQDVLDRINAVEPGVLVAGLKTTGNGITLTDDDGVSAGPLAVRDNAVGQALGLAGTEPGADRTVPLSGTDPNARRSEGMFGLVVRLQRALQAGDDRELARLSPLLDKEASRLAETRGEVASRLKTLDAAQNRLLDQGVSLKADLSENLDADLAEVLSQFANKQAALEATLKIAAQTQSLLLINYL